MKAKKIKGFNSNPLKTRKQQMLDSKKRAIAKKIDEHVRVIKTLIAKMEELEMQELYNGLLANVLSNSQLVEPATRNPKRRSIPVLTTKDMTMIKQISALTDELYNKMGDID